jgi:hypothetical protein
MWLEQGHVQVVGSMAEVAAAYAGAGVPLARPAHAS